MALESTIGSGTVIEGPARWNAVFALALTVAVLIASEFMPVSLLSPIARDLQLSDGQAGQAIAISGLFAVVTSLFITMIAGRLDRRILLLGLSALLVVSGAIVTFAPNFLILMAGRSLLGIAIGGFWSMSAATVMRLVPEQSVPRALAVLNGGNAIASTIAAPLGSYIGGMIGWRGAFFCVIPLAAVAVSWQFLTIPPMAAPPKAKSGGLRRILERPGLGLGFAAVALFFAGQFALFTYLRPFLETVTGVDVTLLSALLLVIGVAGFFGTSMVGIVLRKHLQATLIAIPLILAAIAVALTLVGKSVPPTAVLLAAWGFFSTAAPVAWWSWLTKALPNEAEVGGGLMVATVQLAITLGATLGGFVFDHMGTAWNQLSSAAILVTAAACAWVARRLSQH
jgi:predicted MFS family arabinose efflux permease